MRFLDVGLSVGISTNRVEELGTNLSKQFNFQAKSFDCHAFAMDESNEIRYTNHLVLLRDIDSAFHVHERLPILCCLKASRLAKIYF
jgi:hypothetical protein